MKRCRKCRESKPREAFCRSTKAKDGLASWCRSCTNEKTKEWQRSGKYGLAPGQYEEMLERQGGRCLICEGGPSGNMTRLVVDHDHETGAVRGLLCSKCNVALGMLGHDPDLLRKAADYLDINATIVSMSGQATEV